MKIANGKLEECMMSKELFSKCLNQLINNHLQERGWSVDEVNVSTSKVSTDASDIFDSFLFVKLIENPSLSAADGNMYFNIDEIKRKMKIDQNEFSALIRELASVSLLIKKGYEFNISNVITDYQGNPCFTDDGKPTYEYRLFVNNGFKRACLQLAEQEHININRDH